MNSKKKLLSLLTAAAITASAFTGLAIPASAEGEYYTQDFEAEETVKGTDNNKTADKEADDLTLADESWWHSYYGAGFMSIAKDSNADINLYYQYAIGSASGQRGAYYMMPEDAKTVDDNQRSVLEMDFSMSTGADGSQLLLTNDMTLKGTANDDEKSIPTNSNYVNDYVIALYQQKDGTVSIATLDGADAQATLKGYKAGTWAHLKAVMNFQEDTVVMKITSLDGETEYLEEIKIPMKGDNTAPGALVVSQPRNSSAKTGVDNIVFRPYANGDIEGVYYMATITVDGKTVSRTADKKTGLISDLPDTTKTGYIFQGWAKDGDTENLMTSEAVLATKLTADVTYEAVYEKDPDYIEPLESVEFVTFPTNGIPEMGADADTYADNTIKVKLIGELGNDLLAEENIDSRVTDLKVEWEFDGFRTVVSKNGPTTDDSEGNTYCDSYAQAVYDEDDPTSVNFQLKKESFNFYGQVKATVTYNEKTITISKPMAIVPDKTAVTGQYLPKPGYVADFSPYEDTMVGYQATTSGDNKSATDIVTGDWAAYGGNSGRGLYLRSDDEGKTKFLKLKATGTNSSSFAVNKLDSAPTGQVIISQDVRFYNSGSSILYKTDNPVTWSDNATSIALNFTGNGFQLNSGDTICSATTGDWYHIVLSADVTSKLCYAMVYDMEGTLLGKSDTLPFVNAGSTEPVYLCYRTPDNSQGELDFNNVTMYTPEIAGDLITTISNDTLILPTSELDDGINYKNDTVSVKKSDAKDGDTAVLINAVYNNETLVSVNSYDLTFADGVATQSVHVGKGSKLMVWDSLEGMTPVVDTPLSIDDDNDTSSATLTVDAKSTEGYSMIGDAEWSVVDSDTSEESEYVTVTADESNSHKATLKVAEGAASGTYNVTVSLGGKQKIIPVTVTGVQESVKFTKSTSSIAIPLEDGASDTYEYSAIVVDKNNKDLQRTVTYAMYDKNNENELANTAAISFNKETGVLTVTSEAAATTVYIRATSTNTDGDTISRSLKVTIHGLAFDFGTAAATAEGYTAVAADTAYSETAGYGIASGTPTAGGTASIEDADADYLTGTFKFQADVTNNKIYDVTVNYSGTLASEYVNVDMTGVVRTNETQGAVTYSIPVVDGVLDLSFTGSTVSSIVIEKQEDKQPGGKPTIYAVGDSTENNHGSWGYQLGRDFANYALSGITTFVSAGQGSQNLGSYYNNGNLTDRVLTKIKPGDYVTIGNMGTNGMGSKFEDSFNAYVDACVALGAKVILNSYSPHGAVGEYAKYYDATTHTFTTYRQEEYDEIVRAIYAERSDSTGEKYDENVVGFVDIGKMADAAFNAYVADYSANNYDDEDAAAQAIIACFKDHNHYGDNGYSELAGTLMIDGYKAVGERPGADGIAKTLYNIISADLSVAE